MVGSNLGVDRGCFRRRGACSCDRGIALKPLLLHYAGCGTCRKARAWLDAKGVPYTERAIVDEPPTKAELSIWIPASGLPVRKWLNTSGLSYRALGKEKIAAMSEA